MSARPARVAYAARELSIPAAVGARVRALRVVSPVRARARRTPFVVVVVALLSLGLVGLILITTHLQDQAFELADLQSQDNSLKLQQQRLQTEVDALESPGSVARLALQHGMVPNANPVFLRPSDGQVIGEPRPAPRGTNVKQAN